MSDAIKKLHDYLAKSPSVVYPEDVLAYLPAIEDENAKLQELAAGIGHLLFALDVDYCVACPRDSINHPCPVYTVDGGECLYKTDMRELGVEADG